MLTDLIKAMRVGLTVAREEFRRRRWLRSHYGAINNTEGF